MKGTKEVSSSASHSKLSQLLGQLRWFQMLKTPGMEIAQRENLFPRTQTKHPVGIWT